MGLRYWRCLPRRHRRSGRMAADPFAALLRRMERAGGAAPHDPAGCTPAEGRRLEAGCGLPGRASSRRFLELMGRRSGRLFTHDYLDVGYDFALKATAELPGLLAEWAEIDEQAARFPLPADALIILGRDQEQFHFIRC